MKKYRELMIGLGLFALTFTACNDETVTQSLSLAAESVELSAGDTAVVDISSGNGDYLISYSTDDVVSTKVVDNKIYIVGLKRGTTRLWITDRCGKDVKLSVNVTPHEYTTPVYAGTRAMNVSYDPKARLAKGHTSGYEEPLISWRLLATDPDDVAFDIYKKEGNGSEVKLNSEPIKDATCWQDTTPFDNTVTNTYRVTQSGSTETLCSYELTPEEAKTFYKRIKLTTSVPDAGVDYSVDDVQVGDLDGDGEMEIVVKREPYDGANQGGWYDGTTLMEAYKLDGTFLWQIDLGINIRSGSHYTSYVVYDLDGDGKCEIALRTSEGTKFGDGSQITGSNGKVTDYRLTDPDGTGWYSGKALPTTYGLIFSSPEYISVVNGATGAEIARTNNIPRGGSGSNSALGEYWQEYWGDDYGNRMDRFFMGVAYLDGVPQGGIRTFNPCLIISRGIYLNWQVWALDFYNDELNTRWKFDTNTSGNEDCRAMGSHCFRVADLNGDGYDEILYGSAAIAHDGTKLYCTGNGHGDALHVGKFDPTRSGLQVVACFEEEDTYTSTGFGYGCAMFDAATGQFIAGEGQGKNGDVGRCMVADIDPTSPGCEFWSSLGTGIYSCETGQLVNTELPEYKNNRDSYNNAIFWTGDLTRQVLDDTMIQSYTPTKPWCEEEGWEDWKHVISFGYYGNGVHSNHGTKMNPCYYGDFLGDYREEVIFGSDDDAYLYIFSSNHPTTHRFVHLMQDHTYDMSQAMQNMGYNQPTHLGYYIGPDM